MSESTNPNPAENPPKKKKKSCLKIVGGVFLALILIGIVIPKDETGESSASEKVSKTGESSASEKVSKVEKASGPISESTIGDVACVDLLKKKWTYTATRTVKNNKYKREEKTYTIGDCMTFLHKQVKIFAATWDKYYSLEGFREGLNSGKLKRTNTQFDSRRSVSGFLEDNYTIDWMEEDGTFYYKKDGRKNFFPDYHHEVELWRTNIGYCGGVVTGVDFKWEVKGSEIPGVERVSLYAEFSGYIWCSPQVTKKPTTKGFRFNDVIFETPPKVSVSKNPSIEERKNGFTSAIVYGRRTLKWKRLLMSALVDKSTGEVNKEGKFDQLEDLIDGHFRENDRLIFPSIFRLDVFDNGGRGIREVTIIE